MRGKPPSEAEAQLLRGIWLQDPSKSRRAIHKEFERRYGKGIIGLRKAQQLIPTFSLSPSGEPIPPFKYVGWEPWRSDKVNPETSAFLLTMDAVCVALEWRHLHVHEAKWGMGLRAALQGLMPYDQFCFVSLYAIRTVRSYYSAGDPFTRDLDAILAYKPWLPDNQHPYAAAVHASLAIQPLPYFGPSLGIDESSFAAAEDNFFIGRAWETLRIDLRLPWHWRTLPDLATNTDPFSNYGVYANQDAAVQFWMGDNPIFEPPANHGKYGIAKPLEPGWQTAFQPIPEGESP